MRVALLLLFLLTGGMATAADQGALPAAEEDRYQALIAELRCLVCQNQNIAESNAPLADDLRRQVREMILRGDSNEQIMDYLTARYGDFVLYRPPVKKSTWILWFAPFALLVLGLLIAIVIYRSRTRVVEAEPDAEAIRRVIESRER